MFSLFVSGALSADIEPDYEREVRLGQEAEAGLFDGEVVYLNDGSRDFLSLLFEPEESNLDGALILLHGRGFHPDWPQVAGPLREGLGDLGMATLSLQMPVLEKGAKYYDYLEIIEDAFPRIEAGISYLKSRGYPWIALIAHSCSVHMTMAWIRQSRDDAIDAYVGIGMGATDYRQPMLEEFPLSQMTVPVLDVFGSEDYPAVIKGAEKRYSDIQSTGNAYSRQIQIEGPDHFFEEYESELTQAIAEWVVVARGSN